MGGITTYRGAGVPNVNRINSDGSRDAAFNVGTGFDFNPSSFRANIDGSGRVWVAGAFTQYNGSGHNRIISILPDGAADTSVNPGTGFDAQVNGLGP